MSVNLVYLRRPCTKISSSYLLQCRRDEDNIDTSATDVGRAQRDVDDDHRESGEPSQKDWTAGEGGIGRFRVRHLRGLRPFAEHVGAPDEDVHAVGAEDPDDDGTDATEEEASVFDGVRHREDATALFLVSTVSYFLGRRILTFERNLFYFVRC